MTGPILHDRLLGQLAEDVQDMQDVVQAAANRLRLVTTPADKLDKDGKVRGLGFTSVVMCIDPSERVARLGKDMARSVATVERLHAHLATSQKMLEESQKTLEAHFKHHALAPWVKNQKGLGALSIARLIGVADDPYWNSRDDRPRTAAEFRQYCGFGDPRRQRLGNGEKVNWSPKARVRAWNLAPSIIKVLRAPCSKPEGDRLWAIHGDDCQCSPYRVVYDADREYTFGSVHPYTCKQCGPKGSPALAGSLRSRAHLHAMAHRKVVQEVLTDLWAESKRLHESMA